MRRRPVKQVQLFVLSLAAAACSSAAQVTASTQSGGLFVSRGAIHSSGLTLRNLLDRVKWDAEGDGVLMALDPLAVYLPASAVPPVPEGAKEPDADSLLDRLTAMPLAQAVRPFGYQLHRFGTVTIVAPARMFVYNEKPGKADFAAGMDRTQALLMLEASLTASQWAKIGATDGIGLADLNANQKDLFNAVLPDPFIVEKHTRTGPRMTGTDVIAALTPAQRLSVRIRLNRAAQFTIRNGGGARIVNSSSLNDREHLEVRSDHADDVEPEPETAAVFGVVLRSGTPNRLKPCDLKLEQDVLAREILLEDPSTIGAIVDKIAKSSGLELRTDVRAAPKPLWLRGERAPGTDLLKAICLATTGTFRRLGPAYVFTHDLVGLRARVARIGEWATDATCELDTLQVELYKKLAGRDALRHISFRNGDPLALPPSLMSRLEQFWGKPHDESDHFDFHASDLSTQQQGYIRERLAQFDPPEPITNATEIYPYVTVNSTFLVPGVGPIEFPGGTHLSAYLPHEGRKPAAADPFRIPAELAIRALYIAPTTIVEPRYAVEVAAKRGLNQLWIDLPDEGGQEVLRAAIDAGKAHHIAVGAVMRLFSLQPPQSPSDPKEPDLEEQKAQRMRLEANVLGETAAEFANRRKDAPGAYMTVAPLGVLVPRRDWVRMGDAAQVEKRLSRAVEVAKTPGISGLALRDTAPPGFESQGDSWDSRFDYGSDLGYTPEIRLAYLRNYGIDPIDAAPVEAFVGSANLIPPLFANGSSGFVGPRNGRGARFTASQGVMTQVVGEAAPLNGEQRWHKFRNEWDVRLLSPLLDRLHAAARKLPISCADRYEKPPVGIGWYGSWDKPEGLPHRKAAYNRPPLGQARETSKTVLIHVKCPTTYEPMAFPWVPKGKLDASAYSSILSNTIKQAGDGWDGIVLDLSDMPFAQAMPLLEAITPK